LKGHGFSRADKAHKKSRALYAAEKLVSKMLCNKGTALAGPIKAHKMSWALAPATSHQTIPILSQVSDRSLFCPCTHASTQTVHNL
jgi:hypothetical protein